MLTGRLVRVRNGRIWITPRYVDTADARLFAIAEQLRAIFHAHQGATRGALQQELNEALGTDAEPILVQGLAKLLEDRCQFQVVANVAPEKLRHAVFAAAAVQRRAPVDSLQPLIRASFDRKQVLDQVGEKFGIPAEQVEGGLFADLKSEQRLDSFKDISARGLLERYNVALAQAVLLRSTALRASIRGETPERYRHLLRMAKFHRLICEAKQPRPGEIVLRVDGPLSLFAATQKYALQLALFLPALLLCRDFEIEADLLWGPRRTPKKFRLSADDGLVSSLVDHAAYTPPELRMFADLFQKQVSGWEIAEETRVVPLGDSFWVPDFCLRHEASGREVFLEVLGFWRRASADRHLQRLRQFARQPFVLALSEQLRIDDESLAGLPGEVHRFRSMPLPEEVVRLAVQALA